MNQRSSVSVVEVLFALVASGCALNTPALQNAPDVGLEADDGVPTMDDAGTAQDVGGADDLGAPADVGAGPGDAGAHRNPACRDSLTGSGVVPGPQGLMIQVPSVNDICQMQRALDHVCEAHQADMHDLVLTSVESWQGGVQTTLNETVLDAIAPYLDCFDNVFVGTVSETLLDAPYSAATITNADERWRWIRAARLVAPQIAAWMGENYDGAWNWYISYEANLNAFTDVTYRNAYIALLQQHIEDLQAVNAGRVAWSPTFWTDPSTLSATARTTLGDALSDVFDRVPVDWMLIQDHLGVQPSWTCDDALAYYDLVRAAGPNLASVQLNVEYFTTAGGGIRAGDATELAARVACYDAAGASLGASFEVRYWYEAHGH